MNSINQKNDKEGEMEMDRGRQQLLEYFLDYFKSLRHKTSLKFYFIN